MDDKWFKVLDKDCKAKDGGSFDYSGYITSGSWTPVIKDKKICSSGYHVTRYWNMFLTNDTNRIFEVEVKDLIEEEVLAGVCEKAVCSSLKIVKEFIPNYKNDSNTGDSNTGNSNTGDSNTGNRNTGDSNTGNRNTGYSNTGDSNTGYRNTGDSNTGNRNTGYRNTGYRNTGDSNTGYRNTGDSNTGNRNTGDSNTGNRNTGDSNTGNWNTGYNNTGYNNTGDSNTGNRNTGYRNTGDRNTGYGNTGNRNTGNWNTGSYHAGAFNSKNAEKIYLFDKEILKTDYDKIDFPQYFYFDLTKNYKQSWKNSFVKASQSEIKATIELPNFDYKVFQSVTGISKKMIVGRLK